MAKILLDCSLAGESSFSADVSGTSTTYTDYIEAIGIHDHVAGWGSSNPVREIQLVRHRDRASPKLAQACASGAGLSASTGNNNVRILVFKDDDGTKLVMSIALSLVYVSRYEYGTVDATGAAYRRHSGREGEGDHEGAERLRSAGHTQNDARTYSRSRTRPTPLVAAYPGTATDDEVERVWLSATEATWTIHDGNVTGTAAN